MKKIISWILVYILLVDLTSCHSYIYLSNKQDYETYQNKRHVYALDLTTNRDSMVYFSLSFPGKLSNSEVKGPRQQVLPGFNPDSVIFHKNRPEIRYVMKNNIRYAVSTQDSMQLVCNPSDTIRIPFSEIKQIHIKKADPGKTTALILGAGAAVALALYLIAVNMTFDISLDGL